MLPGEDLIEHGLLDLADGRKSIESLLVAIGAPRLRRVGIDVPVDLPSFPEHQLYEMLRIANGDGAHSRYNALIRRLVSFGRAAENARTNK